MVAKISFGSSLYGALAYNAEKIEEGEGKVLGANKTYYNKEGTFNIHTCMEDFSCYMPSHIKTQKPIVHISLNPHPDDKLTGISCNNTSTAHQHRFLIFKEGYFVRLTLKGVG